MAESKDVDNEANDVSSRSNLGTTNVKRRVVYGRDADIKRRHASLYDVVDGRFANNVFIDKDPYSTRKNAIRKKGISPDEYFASRRRSRELSQERRKKQEKSIERKSRRSALDAFSKVDSDGGAIDDLERIGLADSDLLKQLHAFTADYYAIQSDAKYMYRMMDGSALMALGLLIQEHQRFITRDTAALYAETEDTFANRTGESSQQEQYQYHATLSMSEDEAG